MSRRGYQTRKLVRDVCGADHHGTVIPTDGLGNWCFSSDIERASFMSREDMHRWLHDRPSWSPEPWKFLKLPAGKGILKLRAMRHGMRKAGKILT